MEGIIGMEVLREPLRDAVYTGKVMHQMVEEYYLDMAPYASLSLNDVFRMIADLPFSPDPKNIEVLKRPKYTMEQLGPGGDCDDKAIALASWAKINSIPYRFLGVGRKKPRQPFFSKTLLTHVFPQVYILGEWITCDPTYSFNVLGRNLGGYDRIEIL